MKKRAVSLIEIMIGVLILGTLFLAMSRFFSHSGKTLAITREYNQAVILAKKVIELARATSFDDLDKDPRVDSDGNTIAHPKPLTTFETDLNELLPVGDRVPTLAVFNNTTYETSGDVSPVFDSNGGPSECVLVHLVIRWKDSKNKVNTYEIDTVIARVD